MIKKFESFIGKPRVKVEYHENGQKQSEIWYLNFTLHKEDGPAFQIWYKNGKIKYEIWYLKDKYHREDGPAKQFWYENGQKNNEYWILNGKIHREDGPANNRWYENGQKKGEYLYLNDIRYSREEWIEQLKKIGSIHYEEQKMLFDMEKYNL